MQKALDARVNGIGARANRGKRPRTTSVAWAPRTCQRALDSPDPGLDLVAATDGDRGDPACGKGSRPLPGDPPVRQEAMDGRDEPAVMRRPPSDKGRACSSFCLNLAAKPRG